MIVIVRVMAIGSMSLASLVTHAAEPLQEFDVVVERYVAEALRSNLALQGETLEDRLKRDGSPPLSRLDLQGAGRACLGPHPPGAFASV